MMRMPSVSLAVPSVFLSCQASMDTSLFTVMLARAKASLTKQGAKATLPAIGDGFEKEWEN
jgi:hypothetical protein